MEHSIAKIAINVAVLVCRCSNRLRGHFLRAYTPYIYSARLLTILECSLTWVRTTFTSCTHSFSVATLHHSGLWNSLLLAFALVRHRILSVVQASSSHIADHTTADVAYFKGFHLAHLRLVLEPFGPITLLLLMVPCHRRRRWRPCECDARTLVLLDSSDEPLVKATVQISIFFEFRVFIVFFYFSCYLALLGYTSQLADIIIYTQMHLAHSSRSKGRLRYNCRFVVQQIRQQIEVMEFVLKGER